MKALRNLALNWLALAVFVWWLFLGTGLQLSWLQAGLLVVVFALQRRVAVRADRLGHRPEPLPGVRPDSILVAMDPGGYANLRTVAGPFEVTDWDATAYPGGETNLRLTLRPKGN
jgi:hypothetical protein